MSVDTRVEGRVAVVTLRNPPHNLLSEPLLRELADHLHGVPGDCRAIVLASEGRSFCAGANFRDSSAPDPTVQETFETSTGAFYRQAARVFDTSAPVVAAVSGAAIGAGFGLALACDLRVADARGWFQVNFVKLGIHPGFALSATLPRLIGPGAAADLLLTGRRIDADEAARLGLVDRVVPEDGHIDAAIELAAGIAAGAPLAVAATRATLRLGLVELARSTMAHELAEQARLAGTADAVEGVHAMLEGRAPEFGGR